jgi:hypothetical protein
LFSHFSKRFNKMHFFSFQWSETNATVLIDTTSGFNRNIWKWTLNILQTKTLLHGQSRSSRNNKRKIKEWHIEDRTIIYQIENFFQSQKNLSRRDFGNENLFSLFQFDQKDHLLRFEWKLWRNTYKPTKRGICEKRTDYSDKNFAVEKNINIFPLFYLCEHNIASLLSLRATANWRNVLRYW